MGLNVGGDKEIKIARSGMLTIGKIGNRAECSKRTWMS
jgi:hypothetical protein